MIRRIAAMLALVVGGMTLVGSAVAAERYAYDAARFAKAQSDGEPILVDITASWCPTCKAQNAIIERELLKPEFARFVVFDVDFDDRKDIVRRFGASTQSTLIVFKGEKETARLIGGTDSGVVEAMMRRGE
ncbi:MAG: thioredoxin family protein [Proteobacteria bacterium]|nr:thioredoxin family protein [Pseudomonadota bacterium]